MKFLLTVGISVVMAASFVNAEPTSSLRPTNYVNDFAGVLYASTQARLNDLCRQVDQKARAQIAVVTVKSLDGQDPVSYAVDLYQKWGIGQKGTDRGVLILLATQDRKYWTSVGYGLEPILPDGKVGGFGREAVPFLRNGDYNAAITLMTTRVAEVIAKDAGVQLEGVSAPPVPRAPQPPQGQGSGFIWLIFLVIFVLAIGSLLRRGGSGFWSGFLLSILLNSGGRRGSGGGFGNYGGGGWGGGWGGGGFGGGGGGFGGFGGGSTGGGGAGGSW